QVGELAEPGGVIRRQTVPDGVLWVLGVRLPEGHLGDAVGLLGDAVGEAERLERLDAACLDPIGLSGFQSTRSAFDDPGDNVRELCELCRGDHPGRATADDEDVDFVGKLRRALSGDAGCGVDAWVTGDVPVVVQLHGLSYSRTGYDASLKFDNRTKNSIIRYTARIAPWSRSQGCSRTSVVRVSERKPTACPELGRPGALGECSGATWPGGCHDGGMTDDRPAYKFDPAQADNLDVAERDSYLPADRLIEELGLHGGETVVDYGAGTGYLTLPLAAAVGEQGRVLAVDESEPMVERLRDTV